MFDRFAMPSRRSSRERVEPAESQMHEGGPEALDTIRRLQAEAKAEGLWALGHPKELGGGGLPFMDYVYVNEVQGRSASTARSPSARTRSRTRSCSHQYASTSGATAYLDRLVAAEVSPSFAMTEPEVASAPTRPSCGPRAVLDGDEWVINGQQVVHHRRQPCRLHHRHVPDGGRVGRAVPPPSRMIVVPTDTPGYTIVRETPVLGIRGGHCEVLYDDVRVPADNLLGPAWPWVRDRAGATRSRSDLPLHALARPGAAGVRPAVRPAQRVARRSASRSPTKQLMQQHVFESYAEIQSCSPADPPRRGRHRPGRAGPRRDRHDQGRRCPDAPQRDRPGDPGLRRRRAHRRHAAVATCTGRPGSAGSTTGPTRCTSTPSPAASSSSSGTAPESTSPDRPDLRTDGDDRTRPHQSLRHRHRRAVARRRAVRGQHRPLVVDHPRSQRWVRGGDHPSRHGGRGGRDRSRGHRPGGARQAGPVGDVPLPPFPRRRTGPDRGRGGAVGSVGHQPLGPPDPERPSHGGRTRRGGRTPTVGSDVRRRSGVCVVARRAATPPDRRCTPTDRSRSQRSHALALRHEVGVRRPAVPPQPGSGSDGTLWGLAVAGRAGRSASTRPSSAR